MEACEKLPGGGLPTAIVVDRVTATKIICGAEQFRKLDGKIIGGVHYFSPRLLAEDEARAIILNSTNINRREYLTFEINSRRGRVTPELDSASVIKMRATCDAAEAFLSEQGEWIVRAVIDDSVTPG